MSKLSNLSHGDTFTLNGRTFRVKFQQDLDHGAPWVERHEFDAVSEWTRRDKRPGEWLLCEDRGSKRFYDAAEAQRIAKRDGWGLAVDKLVALSRKLGRVATAGQVRAEAVRLDFEHLRGWCNDDWSYVGVVVTHIESGASESVWGIESGASESVWGIESNADDYLTETAHELAGQIAAELPPVPDGWGCAEFKVAGHYLPALNSAQSCEVMPV